MSVVLISFSATKSLLTIVMVASVEYIKGVYLGFERNVRDPLLPSSIFERVKTSTFSSPTISPSSKFAIWLAVNFIAVQKYKK